jgi:hypothetical protein
MMGNLLIRSLILRLFAMDLLGQWPASKFRNVNSHPRKRRLVQQSIRLIYALKAIALSPVTQLAQ